MQAQRAQSDFDATTVAGGRLRDPGPRPRARVPASIFGHEGGGMRARSDLVARVKVARKEGVVEGHGGAWFGDENAEPGSGSVFVARMEGKVPRGGMDGREGGMVVSQSKGRPGMMGRSDGRSDGETNKRRGGGLFPRQEGSVLGEVLSSRLNINSNDDKVKEERWKEEAGWKGEKGRRRDAIALARECWERRRGRKVDKFEKW